MTPNEIPSHQIGRPADFFHDDAKIKDKERLQHKICGLTQKEISRAIGFARIVLIVGLVFVHYDRFPNLASALSDGIDLHAHAFASWLGSAVLFFFYSVVPLLSMVSGWLFFSFEPRDAMKAIKRRMWRRFISLYMPLVAWNAFYLICIYAFFAYDPASGFFHNLEYTLPLSHPMDFINAIFGVTHRPIGFQFWFVRDLFVTALISPFLWLGVRYAPWLVAVVLCAAWLRGSHMLIFWRPDVPFFFYMGALIRQKNLNISVPMHAALLCLGVYTVLAGLRALAPFVYDPHVFSRTLDVATHLMRLIGVVSCWGIFYRVAQTKRGIAIGEYGGLAFFLHSAHWPLLVVIKMWLWPLMPGDNDFWMLMHYALSVSATVVIGLSLGIFLARKTPRFFALMNGGRLLGQTH
jgi:succinoglycan biosynthesis protein ExoH